jgi:hypothetical protein
MPALVAWDDCTLRRYSEKESTDHEGQFTLAAYFQQQERKRAAWQAIPRPDGADLSICSAGSLLGDRRSAGGKPTMSTTIAAVASNGGVHWRSEL